MDDNKNFLSLDEIQREYQEHKRKKELGESEATEPETTEPEPMEPEPMESEATELEATEPEPMEPETTEPEATEPEITESEPTESGSTEPTEKKPSKVRKWIIVAAVVVVAVIGIVFAALRVRDTATVASGKSFQNTLKEEGYTVTDITDNFGTEDYKSVKNVSLDGYAVQFYEYKDEAAAKENFEYFKQAIENDTGLTKDSDKSFVFEDENTYVAAVLRGKTFVYASGRVPDGKEGIAKILDLLHYKL